MYIRIAVICLISMATLCGPETKGNLLPSTISATYTEIKNLYLFLKSVEMNGGALYYIEQFLNGQDSTMIRAYVGRVKKYGLSARIDIEHLTDTQRTILLACFIDHYENGSRLKMPEQEINKDLLSSSPLDQCVEQSHYDFL